MNDSARVDDGEYLPLITQCLPAHLHRTSLINAVKENAKGMFKGGCTSAGLIMIFTETHRRGMIFFLFLQVITDGLCHQLNRHK